MAQPVPVVAVGRGRAVGVAVARVVGVGVVRAVAVGLAVAVAVGRVVAVAVGRAVGVADDVKRRWFRLQSLPFTTSTRSTLLVPPAIGTPVSVTSAQLCHPPVALVANVPRTTPS